MQLLRNSYHFSSCRDGSSPYNHSTNSAVKSYCRPYWDNQDLRPYISDYYQNLTHSTESLKECPSIKPDASCYLSKNVLSSSFNIFYCNSCRFFVDLFCIFFFIKKTLFFIYPVNKTCLYINQQPEYGCFELFDSMLNCVPLIWNNIYQCPSGSWVYRRQNLMYTICWFFYVLSLSLHTCTIVYQGK